MKTSRKLAHSRFEHDTWSIYGRDVRYMSGLILFAPLKSRHELVQQISAHCETYKGCLDSSMEIPEGFKQFALGNLSM